MNSIFRVIAACIAFASACTFSQINAMAGGGVPVFYVKDNHEDLIKLDPRVAEGLTNLLNTPIERALELGGIFFSNFLSLRKSVNGPEFPTFLANNRDQIITRGDAAALQEVCRYLDINTLNSYRDFLAMHRDLGLSGRLQGMLNVVTTEIGRR